eukprot:746836-Hanusia_phi.AAC.1
MEGAGAKAAGARERGSSRSLPCHPHASKRAGAPEECSQRFPSLRRFVDPCRQGSGAGEERGRWRDGDGQGGG